VVANPTIGLLSDRTCSRLGRRHPWTTAGAALGAIGLVVLALAGNVVVMVIGWCLVQAGLNGMLATLTSAIPDRVPVEQRAQIGGLVGISQMLGTVLGAVVVVVARSSPACLSVTPFARASCSPGRPRSCSARQTSNCPPSSGRQAECARS
jgi:MFS family permease